MPSAAIEAHESGSKLQLTQACWPVFEFLINFGRQVKDGTMPAPDQIRFEALAAIRDAEDRVRDDPVAERNWHDRVKAMMVYLIDYTMLNVDWSGHDYWFDNRFETDPEVLNHVESLGGDKFFEDCDTIQREHETAERRDRRDKDELAEQLSLYFTCLRLGFKGRYHDRPQELADYTRRLFSRLPAYATTRAKEMFPDAYRHNEELRMDYKLGMSLAIMLFIFLSVVGLSIGMFHFGWKTATGAIADAASQVRQGTYFQAPGTVQKEEEKK